MTEAVWIDVGLAGGHDAHYRHEQSVASEEWAVDHNLGKYPSITVIDSSGSEVLGEVVHVSLNSLVVRFSASFSGTAICN